MNAAGPAPAFAAAMRKVLRPLVRAALAQGLGYPALARILKQLYVEEAEGGFRVGGRRQTDSRISLLTGLHRKDVRQLRGADSEERAPPPFVGLGSRVVTAWTAGPPFTDADGRPLPLSRAEQPGGPAGFEALVESVSRDVHPRTVLDELARLGVVRADGDGMVRLDADAFVPREGLEELLYYFGANLHDHAAAAVHNLADGGRPFLELAVERDGLSPEAVEALHAAARARGLDLLQAIDRMGAAEERNGGTSGAARRMRFGIYFYSEPASAPRGE